VKNAGVGVAAAVAVIAVVSLTDVGAIFQRLCGVTVPLVAVMYLFYVLAIYLHNIWSSTSIYVLFATCIGGELAINKLLSSSMNFVSPSDGNPPLHPLVTLAVLVAIAVVSLFSSSLRATHRDSDHFSERRTLHSMRHVDGSAGDVATDPRVPGRSGWRDHGALHRGVADERASWV